ncbi:phytase [Pseudohalioglobus lutimaris]|nr:phytase [Pseudohalioglobus lutimaris]
MPVFATLLATLFFVLASNDVSVPNTTLIELSISAAVETQPVGVGGDAADDAVIWLNPVDPSLSLVIATNKKNGLEVYDLQGNAIQSLPLGRLNNVDLRWSTLNGSENSAVVAASDRSERAIALFSIDNVSRHVRLAGRIHLDFKRPYGLCMYKSGSDIFVFINDKSGTYQQWQIQPDMISGKLVREFKVESTAEGCVVDDQTHTLYLAIEDAGVYAVDARPNGEVDRKIVDTVGAGRLKADVEGLAVYRDKDHQILMASSQGSDAFVAYNLEYPWTPVALISIVDGIVDGTSKTDGIAINSSPMGAFKKGVWVVQDDNNAWPWLNQNFKYVDMETMLDQIERARDSRKPNARRN